MAELAFERLLAGLEAVRGTEADPPTRWLYLNGAVSPRKTRYRPVEQTGTLAEYYRSVDVRRWSEFDGEGGLDVYTLPMLLNTIVKGGVAAPVHPAGGLVGVLEVVDDVVDGETVTIGSDTYQIDIINTDSTDDTAGGNWNNTTDPLTVDCTGMAILALGVGDLLRIENEIMKVTGIDPATDEYTFARGRCGTTAAAHADAEDIYISDAPGMLDIPIGMVATLTPTVFAAALEQEVEEESTHNLAVLITTPAVGDCNVEVVAVSQQALITTGETLSGVGNIWQASGVRNLLWDFSPSMAADDLQSLTLYWGDPGVQEFQAGYCMVDEMTITGDASGTDGVQLSISGQGQFPSKTAPAGVPAGLSYPMLLPMAMEVWIDTAVIGATALAGRVISAEISIPSAVTRKWLASGPAGGLDFTTIGRGKRHAELKLVLELPDMTQYDQWAASDVLKVRVRFNGDSINSYGSPAASTYYFTEFDIYGPFETLDWGEFEGTNRTIELTILSEYDTTALTDWALRVQNNLATL